jgi:hypothetical protein
MNIAELIDKADDAPLGPLTIKATSDGQDAWWLSLTLNGAPPVSVRMVHDAPNSAVRLERQILSQTPFDRWINTLLMAATDMARLEKLANPGAAKPASTPRTVSSWQTMGTQTAPAPTPAPAVAPPPADAGNHCRECGAIRPPSHTFCTNCGAR